MIVTNELTIARWQDRFIAGFVDIAIIAISICIVVSLASSLVGVIESDWYPTTSIIFLLYWVIFEYRNGQSLGKRLLHLQTTRYDGTKPSLLESLVNSFGKSFLLPIDVILGLILTNKKRQRIFNRISNTIVIKVQENGNGKIPYKLD